jgi:hypothetical protein
VTKAQAHALIRGAACARDRLFIACEAYLKLSSREMLELRRADIDFAEFRLRVWPGPGREERLVRFPEQLLGLFRAVARGKKANDLLFPSPRNPQRPLSTRAVRKMLKRTAATCGLRRSVRWLDVRGVLMTESPEDDAVHARDAEKGDAPEIGWLTEQTDASSSRGDGLLPSESPPLALYDAEVDIRVERPTVRDRIRSAAVSVTLRCPGVPPVAFPGIRASDCDGSDGVRVSFPRPERMRDSLSWLPRATRMRFLTWSFRQQLRDKVAQAYRRDVLERGPPHPYRKPWKPGVTRKRYKRS